MSNEIRWRLLAVILKDTVVAYLEVLFQYWFGSTVENNEKPQSR
jgi:hypothetical protein